ncbi:MAG: hypothetical protein HOP28_16490 [Gemmatimonadales bacterium]|nr:hypothetical protein [Gemmatimonadales bacterium]
MHPICRVIIVLVFAVAAACKSKGPVEPNPPPPPPPAPVGVVVVTPGSSSVTVGGQASFAAEVRGSGGAVLTGRTVTWSTTPAGIATIGASGVTTGVAVGTATIAATSEGISGTATLVVNAVPVRTIEVTPATPSVQVGATVQLTGTPKDAQGNALTGRSLTWTAAPAGLVTVSAAGLVTGVAVGLAMVTAAAEGETGATTVTVTGSPVHTVTLDPPSGTLMTLQTLRFGATLRNTAGALLTGRPITWSTSSAATATVSNTGLVTAKAIGDVAITATSEGKTASVTVAVIPSGSTMSATCALNTAGDQYCWGKNAVETELELVPTARDIGRGYVSQDGCNLTAAGEAWCGVPATLLNPTLPAGFKVRSAAAASQTCVLSQQGEAYCKGFNFDGEIGDGTKTPRNLPVPVSGGRRFAAIAVGGTSFTCAITTSSELYCWGRSRAGETGFGVSSIEHLVPTLVPGGLRWRSIAAGFRNSCGVTIDKDLYCWGENAWGLVGDGTTTNRPSPTLVPGGRKYKTVRLAGNLGCALTTANQPFCWGLNVRGGVGVEMGLGTFAGISVLTAVSGGQTFIDIAPGSDHVCGLTAGGAIRCWGARGYGNLADGTTDFSMAPVAVSGGRRFTQLSAGINSTCGVSASGGEVYCWGRNHSAQHGNGSRNYSLIPTKAATALQFASVTVGGWTELVEHACGVTVGNDAYCWGAGGSGQLGTGSTADALTPAAVAGGLKFTQVSVGISAFTLVPPAFLLQEGWSCGLTTAGAAFCWGDNTSGNLGTGASAHTPRTTPIAVSGGHVFAHLAVGGAHACGLKAGGQAWCWGNNDGGQVGDGVGGCSVSCDGPLHLLPVRVVGPQLFTSLAAGTNHTCGLTAAGKAYCWGAGGSGKLGASNAEIPPGTFNSDARSTPIAVAGGLSFTAVTAGEMHTCALTAAGAAWCWGNDRYGQLGAGGVNRTSEFRLGGPTPLRVAGPHLFISITAGAFHTCALTAAEAAYCWGYNDIGSLGIGTSGVSTMPVLASGAQVWRTVQP